MQNINHLFRFCVCCVLLCGTIFASAKTHIVAKGETLDSICRMYNITVEQFNMLNPQANGRIFTGMEIEVPDVVSNPAPTTSDPATIPEQEYPTQQSQSAATSTFSALKSSEESTSTQHYADNSDSDFENKRLDGVFCLQFMGMDFSGLPDSGFYGVLDNMPCWNVSNRLYAGLEFGVNINSGLSDPGACLIQAGPQLAYYFAPCVYLSVPLDLLCYVYFEGDDSKTSWGLLIPPTLFAGSKKIGLFAGPLLTCGFSSGSEVTAGFRAGLYFNF